jgi:aryl-alcohol dehydrogenase-like predicted oxidoreductase
VIFGAAALASLDQEAADDVLPLLLRHGINHIDTAASYGDAELRLAPWLRSHPDAFFLATKTEVRDGAGARASLERSLTRLGVDSVDLIQLHNLALPEEWEAAHARGGALEALQQAREEGMVRFIGVTGHGLGIAAMHLRSLERFDYDSVLLPYSALLLGDPDYRRDLEALLAVCSERDVAVQTIKAIARRPWGTPEPGPGERRLSWYEPLTDPDAIDRAVRFVLSDPRLFIDSPSALDQLPLVLEAAAAKGVGAPTTADLAGDASAFDMVPLFQRS